MEVVLVIVGILALVASIVLTLAARRALRDLREILAGGLRDGAVRRLEIGGHKARRVGIVP